MSAAIVSTCGMAVSMLLTRNIFESLTLKIILSSTVGVCSYSVLYFILARRELRLLKQSLQTRFMKKNESKNKEFN